MDPASRKSSNPSQLAINAALECRWDDALKLNRQIIKEQPENVDALNRLARVYLEKGSFSLSKKYYTLALKYDPYNPIASKNLKIIQAFKKDVDKSADGEQNGKIPSIGRARISPDLFLHEPGKTKIISLLKVAEPQRLSQTYCGMPVNMVIKNRGVTVLDNEDRYLGVLPDDVSHLIIKLIKGGNKYAAFVKSVKVNGLALLIRETFRANKFRNQPSFLEYSQLSQSMEMLAPLEKKDRIEEDLSDGESEEES
jgi:hypothetical protein